MTNHRAVIVIELSLEHVEQIAEALTAINPPSIPAFAGAVRVAVGDVATALVEWLDEDTGQEHIAVKPAPIDPPPSQEGTPTCPEAGQHHLMVRCGSCGYPTP